MAKKNEGSAQTVLFHELKDSLPANISFVDELAELLNCSNDSAYRRIRGETALSIEEISAICKHFKLSFDNFLNNNNNGNVTFTYYQLSSHVNTYKEYLLSIKNDLGKIVSYDKKQIVYSAIDIPIFHHFFDAELTAFKMFYWNKSIINAKGFDNNKYDRSLIDGELLEIAAKILEYYSNIPSIEIWSDDTVNSTIKQIEFYWDACFFKSKDDAIHICSLITQMVNRIKEQAAFGRKSLRPDNGTNLENNYALYHSDIMIGNNCILVNTGNTKSVYLSCQTFNTMVTTNAQYCHETELWLQNLVRKSNLVSGVAEKQRYILFKNIEDKLSKLVHKIENF